MGYLIRRYLFESSSCRILERNITLLFDIFEFVQALELKMAARRIAVEDTLDQEANNKGESDFNNESEQDISGLSSVSQSNEESNNMPSLD